MKKGREEGAEIGVIDGATSFKALQPCEDLRLCPLGNGEILKNHTLLWEKLERLWVSHIPKLVPLPCCHHENENES